MTTRLERWWLVCVVCIACGDSSGPGSPGSIDVNVVGLPAQTAAAVTVIGPGGFTRTVTTSTTLSALTPGTYTIGASSLTVAGVTYVPTPQSQTVTVSSSAGAVATVTYSVVAAITLGLETVATGLSSPVFVASPPGDSRLFIVEQTGRIRIFANGALLPTPFIDVRSRITSGGERGLLSIAFHPQYATNGFFFLNYTDLQGNTRVDRWHVSADPNVADPATSTLILAVAQPFSNHNGGLVMFGPDGMFYIGMGDGGSGGDPQGHGQNRNSLLGKMLRIDVNGALPYTVPSNNPFVGQAGVRPEIWALGLRNPWRFSFDRVAGLLYMGDVGQGAREEIDVASASEGGINYGWNTMEGTACYAATNCNRTGLTLPVLDYDHSQGCSVAGGYVYRGTRMPEIVGRYFYSDYCSGWIRSFRFSNGVVNEQKEWSIPAVADLTSFGEDASGELYVMSQGGTVYRVVRR